MNPQRIHRAWQLAVASLALAAGTALAKASDATAPVAHTQQFPTLSLSQANAAITAASHGAVHAVRVFSGPDELVGAVIEDAAKRQNIVWLTPHGGAVLNGGTLFDRAGMNLSRAAMFAQGLLLSPAAVLKQAADPSRHSIAVGRSGPRITVLFDPNCVYCHGLYNALSAQVAAGHVRVRYVVVGTLKASSVPRAASLLAAKDPVKALAINEADYDGAKEEGGYPIIAGIDPALTAVVAANNALFGQAGAVGTPAIFYCAKATGTAQVAMGVPGDIKAFIAGAASSPEKECH